MIFRLVDIYHARRDLAAAREDAATAMRLYARQCKRTAEAKSRGLRHLLAYRSASARARQIAGEAGLVEEFADRIEHELWETRGQANRYRLAWLSARRRAGSRRQVVEDLTVRGAVQRARIAELDREAQELTAAVRRLQVERNALAEALDKSRDVAAGREADNAELRRELARLRPKGADPVTAPRADAGELARLRTELDRTKRALAAAHNLLAVAEGRDIQGSVAHG